MHQANLICSKIWHILRVFQFMLFWQVLFGMSDGLKWRNMQWLVAFKIQIANPKRVFKLGQNTAQNQSDSENSINVSILSSESMIIVTQM